jgi:hypothetical protein
MLVYSISTVLNAPLCVFCGVLCVFCGIVVTQSYTKFKQSYTIIFSPQKRVNPKFLKKVKGKHKQIL